MMKTSTYEKWFFFGMIVSLFTLVYGDKLDAIWGILALIFAVLLGILYIQMEKL